MAVIQRFSCIEILPVGIVHPNKDVKHQATANDTLARREICDRGQQCLYVGNTHMTKTSKNYS